MRRFVAALCALSASLTLAGCLTPSSSTPPDQFLLRSSLPVQQAEKLPVTLGLRQLDAARPYNISMAHADADGRMNYYQSATWAEFPAAAITRQLRDAINRTGRFSDTGMAERMARPDCMLIGYLEGFQEDRSTATPQAVISVRLELRHARAVELLWSASLTESEPLQGEGPAALASAMDKAVARLVSLAANQIAAAPIPANLGDSQ